MPALARADDSRLRLRPSTFRFAIQQVVEFGDLRGIVTACERTFAGREIYNVTFDCADRPNRTIRGEYLAPVDAPEARHGCAAVRAAGRPMRVLPQIRQAQLLAA